MSTPKKYTDFPAGTYNTSKIFLQADPVTGALEKINLPTLSGGSQVITGPVNSTSTTPENLLTLPIAANLITGANKVLFIEGLIKANTVTGTPQASLRINTTDAVTLSFGSNQWAFFQAWLWYNTSSQGYSLVYGLRQNSLLSFQNIASSPIPWTTGFNVSLRKNAGLANEFTAYWLRAQVY